MTKDSCLMIDELEIERHIKENFDVVFVNTPCFSAYNIVNKNGECRLESRSYSVTTHLFEGIETINLSKDGLGKLYIFKDELDRMLIPLANINTGGTSLVIRMKPIYANIRYKLNKNRNERRN